MHRVWCPARCRSGYKMITRRFWLIGTAASIALAVAPKLSVPERLTKLVLPLDSQDLRRREIVEVLVSNTHSAQPSFCQIKRVKLLPLNLSVGPGGLCRWISAPGAEIVLKDTVDGAALIDWQTTPEVGDIHLVFRNIYEDDSALWMSQHMHFRGEPPPVIELPQPMRLERIYPLGHPKYVEPEPLKDWDDDEI